MRISGKEGRDSPCYMFECCAEPFTADVVKISAYTPISGEMMLVDESFDPVQCH